LSVRSVFTVPAANRRSGVIEERHEAEVHVQLVTVKQGRPRIVRDEIDFMPVNEFGRIGVVVDVDHDTLAFAKLPISRPTLAAPG
jgi:hypothetical protein